MENDSWIGNFESADFDLLNTEWISVSVDSNDVNMYLSWTLSADVVFNRQTDRDTGRHTEMSKQTDKQKTGDVHKAVINYCFPLFWILLLGNHVIYSGVNYKFRTATSQRSESTQIVEENYFG